MRNSSLLWLLLAALCCAGARADNPKISLKLEQVDAYEAAAALTKASGVEVQLPDPAARLSPKPAVDLKEKTSFNWTDITLARALRELATHYNLRLQSSLRGFYSFYPAFAPPAGAPPNRVGLYEKGGVQLFVRRLQINAPRAVDFEGGGGAGGAGSLSVVIGAELGEGEAERIAGLEGVAAKDDLGNLLVSPVINRPLFTAPMPDFQNPYPDQWTGHVNLPSPHPKARRLAWVEGDLLVYKNYERRQVELPVPEPGKPTRAKLREAEVEVTDFRPAPPAPAPEASGAGPRRPALGRAFGPYVEVRIITPPASHLQAQWPSGSVALIGVSGKRYFGNSTSGSSEGDARGTQQLLRVNFGAVPEPVKSVAVSLVERGDPEKLFSFRLLDIPLPGENRFVPQRAIAMPDAARVPGSAGPERPFQEAGGGTLVLPVRIHGKAAGAGDLSLALSRQEGAEWSGNRWVDVPVQADGIGRLTDLKPGTYRLVRTFRLKEVPAATEDGHWVNGEVTVQVAAGQELQVTPLLFTSTAAPPPPAPRSAAPASPAVKPRKKPAAAPRR